MFYLGLLDDLLLNLIVLLEEEVGVVEQADSVTDDLHCYAVVVAT